MKRGLALLIILFISSMTCLTGCNNSPKKTIESAQSADNAEKILKSSVYMITDMAGRKVQVPEKINKVYSTGQPGIVMLYTVNPDKLLGWCMKPSESEAEYIQPKYLSLPVLGLMQGGNNTANKEEIIGRKPDIILFMGAIDESQKNTADEIQATLQIPVIMADYSLKELPNTYRFLGKLLGEEKRCTRLADYCQNTLDEASANTAKVQPKEKLDVYYAQGAKGLQTAPKASSHSEVINLVGGNNVAVLESVSDGRIKVNLEQVLLWNPDVILVADSMGHTSSEAGKAAIADDNEGTWNLIKAVKNKRVFNIPAYPYNWLDMPPSVNRMIGIKWLGNLLYPQYFNYDIKEEITKFYALFYHKDLTEEELNKLLDHAASIE